MREDSLAPRSGSVVQRRGSQIVTTIVPLAVTVGISEDAENILERKEKQMKKS